ncbi:MAG: hypothetical protein GY778_02580 [bacterium]|nr:hypothetical protein [bacterium]
MAKTEWKLRAGSTWRQKLEQEHPNHGKIVPVPPRMQKRFGTGTMIIPRPLDVDAVMRKVRKGKLLTQSQLRDELAALSEADSACPMTTGIFIRMVAEAAEEDRRAGKKRITPYWRTIRDNGDLNEKFPGQAKAQAAKLRKEGFTIAPGKGKRPPGVKDFEKYLMKL